MSDYSIVTLCWRLGRRGAPRTDVLAIARLRPNMAADLLLAYHRGAKGLPLPS